MDDFVLAKITRKGQMTIPQEMRDALNLHPGDYVALRSFMGSVLVSKAEVTSQIGAPEILHSLVYKIGQEAERQGIREEEDLDDLVEQAQEEAYKKQYGR